MAILKEVFKSLGLEHERIKLKWISASEGKKFAEHSNEFTDKISNIGENPIKKNIFL